MPAAGVCRALDERHAVAVEEAVFLPAISVEPHRVGVDRLVLARCPRRGGTRRPVLVGACAKVGRDRGREDDVRAA